MLTASTLADSWYDRLSNVASTLICQWARIKLGFTSAGGKYQEPTDTNCERLLGAVPTPPISDNTFPPFHIEDTSINEILDLEDEEDKPSPLSPTDVAVELIHRRSRLAETPRPLDPQVLAEANAAGDEFTLKSSNAIYEAISMMPSASLTPATSDTYQHELDNFKPTKAYGLDLSHTDLALYLGNTANKVEIVLALAAAERKSWGVVHKMCVEKLADWDQQIQRLEAMREFLKEDKDVVSQLTALGREKYQRISALEEETASVRHLLGSDQLEFPVHRRGINMLQSNYPSVRGHHNPQSPIQGTFTQSPGNPQYNAYYRPAQGVSYVPSRPY